MLPRIALTVSLCAFALPAFASDTAVRLESFEGGLVVEGNLKSTQGEFYRVETESGTLTIDTGAMTCEGPGCPADVGAPVGATIDGPPDLLTELLAPLVSAFARSRGLSFSEVFRGDDQQTWWLTDQATRRPVARFTVGPSEAPDLIVSRSVDTPERLADIIALDAIVPIVAPTNPATTVSSPTLRLLLEGRLKTWPEALTGLSGGEAPEVSLHLPESLAALGRIWPYSPITPPAKARRYVDPDDLADAVASDPGGIGIVPLSRIGNASPLVLSGPCGRVLTSTPALVKAEDYPLTEPIYLERASALQPRIVRDFIAFAQSPAAQPIIRRTGFVDQSIGYIPFRGQGDRLASAFAAANTPEAEAEVRRMVRTLGNAARLTLTFRFEDGETTLDAPSRSNVRQLAEAIIAGTFVDSEIVFVGFTDGQGPAEPNLRLSVRRAESVVSAVQQRIGDSDQAIATDGFGEALPMACDDTIWGREINRRVEVWVRELPARSD